MVVRGKNYADWLAIHSEIREKQKELDNIYKELIKEGNMFFKSQLNWNDGATMSQGTDFLQFKFSTLEHRLEINLEDLNATKDFFTCSKVDLEIYKDAVLIKLGEW